MTYVEFFPVAGQSLMPVSLHFVRFCKTISSELIIFLCSPTRMFTNTQHNLLGLPSFQVYQQALKQVLGRIHRSKILNAFHGDWGLRAFSG